MERFMDRELFDTIARLAGAKKSRRAALGVLLGSAMLGHPVVSVSAKRNGKEGVRAARERPCYRGTTCTPGKGRNNAECDFTNSLAFFELDVRGSNLSNANFTEAEMAGANLQGVNLGGACLVGANLLGAKIDASTNLGGAIFCRTLMPDGSFEDRDCGQGTHCCPAPFNCEGDQCPAQCIDAPNAQCSLNVPYGGCCPGLRCVFSSTNPIRTTCQAPCGDDKVCHRFGAAWHCAFEPVICRYLRGDCCQHI
jgi:hypothetical protein